MLKLFFFYEIIHKNLIAISLKLEYLCAKCGTLWYLLESVLFIDTFVISVLFEKLFLRLLKSLSLCFYYICWKPFRDLCHQMLISKYPSSCRSCRYIYSYMHKWMPKWDDLKRSWWNIDIVWLFSFSLMYEWHFKLLNFCRKQTDTYERVAFDCYAKVRKGMKVCKEILVNVSV